MTEGKEPPAGLVPRFPRKKVNSTRALLFLPRMLKRLLGLKQRAARKSPRSRWPRSSSPLLSPACACWVTLPLLWDRLQLVAATRWLPGKGAGFYSFPPQVEHVHEEAPTEISEGHEQR